MSASIKAQDMKMRVAYIESSTTGVADKILAIRALCSAKLLGKKHIRFATRHLFDARFAAAQLPDPEGLRLLQECDRVEKRLKQLRTDLRQRAGDRAAARAASKAAEQPDSTPANAPAVPPDESPEDAWMRMVEENRKKYGVKNK
jgi:hypothetical protein